MKIFRFWSTFSPRALPAVLAELVEIKTPEQMAMGLPLHLTAHSTRPNGFAQGIVLGLIISAAERDCWSDNLRGVAAEAPFRLPGVGSPEAVYCADADASPDLQEWMILRLNAAARAFAEEAATAGLAAAQLRIRLEGYEQMMREKRIEVQAVSLRQTISADGRYRALDADGVAVTLNPSIAAPHAIDLLFDCKEPDEDESVLVELVGLETDVTIASWTLTPGSKPGWHQFWVPYSLAPSLEICQVRVRASRDTSRWSVALGRLDPGHFFSADLPTGAPSIACRVWERSAFCTSPPSPLAIVPDGLDAPPRRTGRIHFLASDLVAHAVALDPRHQDRLQWRDDVSAFQIHPSGRRPVVACLRGVTVTDVETITADVILAHPKAQDTKFAVWAAPTDTLVSPVPPSALQASRWKLAGRSSQRPFEPAGLKWLTLAGSERGVLNYRFEQRYTGEIDIFVATCNRTEKSDFAWALFERVVVQ